MTCKVATCSLHICRSFVMSLMPPQIFPISLISFSTVHRQLFLGRRFHSRVQCRAVYPTSTTSTTICLLSRNGGFPTVLVAYFLPVCIALSLDHVGTVAKLFPIKKCPLTRNGCKGHARVSKNRFQRRDRFPDLLS